MDWWLDGWMTDWMNALVPPRSDNALALQATLKMARQAFEQQHPTEEPDEEVQPVEEMEVGAALGRYLFGRAIPGYPLVKNVLQDTQHNTDTPPLFIH